MRYRTHVSGGAEAAEETKNNAYLLTNLATLLVKGVCFHVRYVLLSVPADRRQQVLRERAKELSAHVVFFSSLTQLEEGCLLYTSPSPRD